MDDKQIAVEFVAEIRQVRSMSDHSVNITLNLPEYAMTESQWFLVRIGEMVRCVAVVEDGTVQR